MKNKIEITYIYSCDKEYYNLHLEIFSYNRIVVVRKKTDNLYKKYNDYLNEIPMSDKPISYADGEGSIYTKLTEEFQDEIKEMLKNLIKKLN